VLTRSPTELTTAATDALLAAICVVEAWRLMRIPTPFLFKQQVWLGVLALMAVGAVVGVLVHGLELTGRTRTVLWRPLYLSLGLAVALVVIGACADWLGESVARRWLPWALGAGAAFFFAREWIGGGFALFLVYEGMAVMTALAIYVALAAGADATGASTIATGLGISLLAGIVQRSGWRAHLVVPFDHNGLFHLVQTVGIIVVAAGVRARL